MHIHMQVFLMLYHCLGHTSHAIIIAYEHAVLLLICSMLYSQHFTIEIFVVSMYKLFAAGGAGGS